METVLGIDAGGTKTLLAVVDQDGRVVQLEKHSALDPTQSDTGAEDLRAVLAGRPPVAAATLGLPYFGEIPEVTAWQTETAKDMLGPMAIAVNDVSVAHHGAFAGQNGVLVLAGTGSMAWSVGPNGPHRVGGFGEVFGDEGSAYWIGRAALAAASRQMDSRLPNDGFLNEFCAAIGVAPEDLIDWTFGQSEMRTAIAGLARHVSGLAKNRQPTAIRILKAAAAELALAANAAARLSGLGNNPDWSFAGGVFADQVVKAELTAQLGRPPSSPVLAPIGGAILEAANRAGWSVGNEWISNVAAEIAAKTPSP